MDEADIRKIEEAGRLAADAHIEEKTKKQAQAQGESEEPVNEPQEDGEVLVPEEAVVDAIAVPVVEEQLPMDFESVMARLTNDMAMIKEETSLFQVQLEEQIRSKEALQSTQVDAELVVSEFSMLPLKPHEGSWHHAVTCDWRWLAMAPAEVWGDADLVMKALAQDPTAMQYASGELRSNRGFALEAMQIAGLSLQHVSEDLRADKDVVEVAVRQNRLALRYASPELRADKSLIELAMRAGEPWRRGGQAVQSEAEHLNSDKLATHEAVFSMDPERWHIKIRRDWRRLQMAPTEAKGNRELVLEAIKDSWGQALQYASDELRADREIVMEAVKIDGLALRYASEDLRNSLETVHTAASQNWQALAYASAGPRADRSVMQDSAQQHWEALQYASPELCADRDFMLTAVAQHGHCLKYASTALRAYRSVVLKAVRQTWEALKHADPSLQDDPELCLVAAKPALCFASETWYPEEDQQLRRQQRRRDNTSSLAQFPQEELQAGAVDEKICDGGVGDVIALDPLAT